MSKTPAARGIHGYIDKNHPKNLLVFNRDLWYYRQVRVFKNTRFARFAQKEGISDEELREVVRQLEVGQSDADLGGDRV